MADASTRVPRAPADAALPRGWWRGPGGTAKRRPGVRDVTRGEDARRLGTGAGPQVKAGRRQAALGVRRSRQATTIAAA